MAQNTINNRSSTLTVDNNLTVTTGGATIDGATSLNNGVINISTDAAASTLEIGAGAGVGAKNITIGNLNADTSVRMDFGTNDFIINTSVGTVYTAHNTGEISMPFQPAFLGILSTENNVSGNATVHQIGSSVAATEIYDQTNDFDPGGGGNPAQFVASVAGEYLFTVTFEVGIDSANGGTEFLINLVSTSTTFELFNFPTRTRVTNLFGVSGNLAEGGAMLIHLDATDTVHVTFDSRNGTGTPDDFIGGSFSGYLVG